MRAHRYLFRPIKEGSVRTFTHVLTNVSVPSLVDLPGIEPGSDHVYFYFILQWVGTRGIEPQLSFRLLAAYLVHLPPRSFSQRL